MFTGIVEELGRVEALEPSGDGVLLRVHGPTVTADARHGDSISVSGVCLTVVEHADGSFTADVMRESLQRSSLGALKAGDPVNLERAVRVQDRLGGHVVQGHVDGVGRVEAVVPGERWTVVRVSLPVGLARYVVEKGSITVDGVSLTVSAVDATSFEVSLIPTTLALTTLGARSTGDPVNLEVDVMAKHIEKLLTSAGRLPS